MTSTEQATRPIPAGPPPDDDTTHIVCNCQKGAERHLAFCGHDATDDPEGASDSICVVCVDLLNRPCARCGRSY